jgi:hypothetical protein
MNNIDGWIGVMSFWIAAVTLTSLYFMYNVRNTQEKYDTKPRDTSSVTDLANKVQS